MELTRPHARTAAAKSTITVVGRVAAVTGAGIAAIALSLAAPATASARPDLCQMTECPPPPRVDNDHSDIGTGGGHYPAPGYYPDVPTCADAANTVECYGSEPL